MKSTLLPLLLLGSSVALQAVSIPVPTTTVNGTDVFSGPGFTLGDNYAATDSFSLTAVGTVDLAAGNFTANAAGVIVAPPTTNTGDHPGQISLAGNGLPYASLLIGNATLGFVPFFPADASAGLGSPTPPTTVTATRTIADLWPSQLGLASGTTLEFRINDINIGDNGGFVIVQAPDAGASFALLGLGLAGLAMVRPRKS